MKKWNNKNKKMKKKSKNATSPKISLWFLASHAKSTTISRGCRCCSKIDEIINDFHDFSECEFFFFEEKQQPILGAAVF